MAKNKIEQVLPLDEKEKGDLEQLETQIANGRLAFLDIGQALKTIKDDPRKLYRQFGTFQTYVGKRWGFTDRRAQQLMGAVEVVVDLKNRTKVRVWPATETQVRELGLASIADRPTVWKAVVERAKKDGNRRVTAADVRAVREVMFPTHRPEKPADPPATATEGTPTPSRGRVERFEMLLKERPELWDDFEVWLTERHPELFPTDLPKDEGHFDAQEEQQPTAAAA